MNQRNHPIFAIRPSGDGYELLDAEGKVIAWTLDRIWALKILLALELERMETKEQGNK